MQTDIIPEALQSVPFTLTDTHNAYRKGKAVCDWLSWPFYSFWSGDQRYYGINSC